jgi:hypothetical protein
LKNTQLLAPKLKNKKMKHFKEKSKKSESKNIQKSQRRTLETGHSTG